MNKNYFLFINKLLLKKKSTIIIPVINLLMIILTLILNFTLAKSIENFLIIFYINILINGILSSLYGSIKALNIFKDLQSEGIEIIVFSKSITRHKIVFTKLINFAFWSMLWSFVSYWILSTTLFLNLNFINSLNIPFLWIFLSPLFIYLFFGLISILISSRFSSKISIAFPLLFFMPFTTLGSIISIFSTSSENKFGEYLNINYPNYDSGKLLDVEKFYLNNNKDELYIIPKNVDNKSFSQREKEFLELAKQKSKNSSTLWQAYSLLSLPYQFLDIYNNKDKDALSYVSKSQINNLENYLNYKNLDSGEYNYKLELNNNNLLKVAIQDDDSLLETKYSYLVPGALKNSSHFENVKNREIIYSRENASNFEVSFPEDDKIVAVPEDLVGKLKWEIIEEVLKSAIFDKYAYKTFIKVKNYNKNDLLKYFENILSSNINNSNDDNFSKVIDNNTELLKEIIDTNKIKNLTEKKIYFITSLLYYAYFHPKFNKVILTFLEKENDGKKYYNPDKFEISFDNKKYFIGGYSTYSPIQQIKNDKIIYRFSLEESNNFLFQPVDEVYSYKAINRIVYNKNINLVIWSLVVTILAFSSYVVYKRKDYK
ncbi:hypothetical protein [Mycoplasma sp. 613B]